MILTSSQGGKSLMPKETVALLPSSPCPAQPAPGKLHRLKALSTSLGGRRPGWRGVELRGLVSLSPTPARPQSVLLPSDAPLKVSFPMQRHPLSLPVPSAGRCCVQDGETYLQIPWQNPVNQPCFYVSENSDQRLGEGAGGEPCNLRLSWAAQCGRSWLAQRTWLLRKQGRERRKVENRGELHQLCGL